MLYQTITTVDLIIKLNVCNFEKKINNRAIVKVIQSTGYDSQSMYRWTLFCELFSY